MKARLIVADDHPLVCQGLTEIASRQDDFEVVASAHDGNEAERLARERPAELLLLDVAMPGKNGIRVLESLRADGITLPILFFSMYPAAQYATYVRRAGAQGFVGKDVGEAEVLAAIRRVLVGGSVFPGRSADQPAKASAAPLPVARLSARENEVLQGLLRGKPLVEIAVDMGVSAQGVTTYRRRLLDKLGVANNAELIARLRYPD